jgi:hypothetical protein
MKTKLTAILLASTTALALIAAPAIAQSDGAKAAGGVTGSIAGAVTGGLIFGPIGAVIGGFTGAVIGTATVDDNAVEYVRVHPTEPVMVDGTIEVGYVVPDDVELHVIEGDDTHGYFYTNDRVYFVDLDSRAVVYSPGTVVAEVKVN